MATFKNSTDDGKFFEQLVKFLAIKTLFLSPNTLKMFNASLIFGLLL